MFEDDNNLCLDTVSVRDEPCLDSTKRVRILGGACYSYKKGKFRINHINVCVGGGGGALVTSSNAIANARRVSLQQVPPLLPRPSTAFQPRRCIEKWIARPRSPIILPDRSTITAINNKIAKIILSSILLLSPRIL